MSVLPLLRTRPLIPTSSRTWLPESRRLVRRTVASSTRAGRVARLDMGYARIGPQGAAALAAARGFGPLTWLDLSGNPLGDAGVAALAGWPLLSGVTYLDLSQCRIGDDGARALARSPHLRSVRTLALQGGPMGPDEVAAFERNPHRDIAIKVRLWDERAKDPDMTTPDFQHFRPVLERLARAA